MKLPAKNHYHCRQCDTFMGDDNICGKCGTVLFMFKSLSLWTRFKLWWSNPERMNGVGRCPDYLHRWVLIDRKNFKIYLHHFLRPDWSTDLHDHPKRFLSIGLWGSYVERTPSRNDTIDRDIIGGFDPGPGAVGWDAGGWQTYRKYRAPWIRTFPASHRHRITQVNNAWTLVVVLKKVRDWGFWPRGKFVPWRQYVQSTDADANKDC